MLNMHSVICVVTWARSMFVKQFSQGQEQENE